MLLGNQHGDFRAAQNHSFCTLAGQFIDCLEVILPGLRLHGAQAQFFIDNPVHFLLALAIGYQHLNCKFVLHPALVEILLHGESGAQQTHLANAILAELRGRGIGNMQQGNVNGCLNLRGHLVHGIGTDHQKIGAAGLHPLASQAEDVGSGRPVICMLELFDFMEIDTGQTDPGGMQAAKPLLDTFIHEAVIGAGGFPTHATQHADGFHGCDDFLWVEELVPVAALNYCVSGLSCLDKCYSKAFVLPAPCLSGDIRAELGCHACYARHTKIPYKDPDAMMKPVNRHFVGSRPLWLLLASLFLNACASSGQNPPGSFVELGEYAPDIRLEVRYFSSNNFVGEAIDGYQSARIFMTRDAAEALVSVQQELRAFGLGLKVFDAYRPQQAVDHFVRWAEDLDDQRMKSRYYPQVDKRNLFSDGYIASRSGHSRGSTVDLTLIDFASGEELDMGTPWDYFDLASWPDSDQISTQQQANRLLLRKFMLEAGFQPLSTEWWHFTLADEPYSETYFNFPVR